MTDLEIDAALAQNKILEDSEEEIEELAHLCRTDYLAQLEETDPESYIKGAARDKFSCFRHNGKGKRV